MARFIRTQCFLIGRVVPVGHTAGGNNNHNKPQVQVYIQSKCNWMKQAVLAYCQQFNANYAIAKASAMGLTFCPPGFSKCVTILTLAGNHDG